MSKDRNKCYADSNRTYRDSTRYPVHMQPMNWFNKLISQHVFPSLSEGRLVDFRELRSLSHGDMPNIDLLENDHEFILSAELPGVEKAGLDVSVGHRSVLIEAYRNPDPVINHGLVRQREMNQSYFARTIPLGCEVDSARARAGLRQGLLEITLPKRQPFRRIEIDVE